MQNRSGGKELCYFEPQGSLAPTPACWFNKIAGEKVMDNNKIAYDALCAEEQSLLAQLARKRQMIEQLAEELGETPPSLDLLSTSDGQPLQTPQLLSRNRKIEIRTGEFYTFGLASVFERGKRRGSGKRRGRKPNTAKATATKKPKKETPSSDKGE